MTKSALVCQHRCQRAAVELSRVVSTHPIEKRERLDSAAEGREAAAGGARGAQLEAEEVDDEQQEVRALGVPQELVAGASAHVRALDDAGQVGH